MGCKRGTFLCPFCTPIEFRQFQVTLLECMAGTTGLEPATSAVTGQRSNQLSYVPRLSRNNLRLCHLEPARARTPPRALRSMLPPGRTYSAPQRHQAFQHNALLSLPEEQRFWAPHPVGCRRPSPQIYACASMIDVSTSRPGRTRSCGNVANGSSTMFSSWVKSGFWVST